MRDSSPAIVCEGLTKRYRGFTAVDNLSFSVPKGSLYGLLGPNGAGKTTTIGMLSTLLRPSAGCAWIDGYSVIDSSNKIRQSIGYVFQQPTLDGYLSAEQNLRFHARLFNMGSQETESRLSQLLEFVGLSDRRREPVSRLSGGMRRRLEIIRALMHRPAVLFLDEPTVGLDPQSRRAIWDQLSDMREQEGLSIVLTTHHMDEAEHCDRIAIVDRGKLLVEDATDSLKASIGKDRIMLSCRAPAVLAEELRDKFDILSEVQNAGVSFMAIEGASYILKILPALVTSLSSIQINRPSLDDVYLAHTTSTEVEGASAGRAEASFRMRALGREGAKTNPRWLS